MRADLAKLLKERGADMADVPAGSTGILCRDFKGKDADREVTKVDGGGGMAPSGQMGLI